MGVRIDAEAVSGHHPGARGEASQGRRRRAALVHHCEHDPGGVSAFGMAGASYFCDKARVPSCVRAGSAGKLQPPPAACQPAQGRGDPGRQVGRAASRACGVGGGADSPNRRARTARGARPRRQKGRRAARASSCGRGPGAVCGGRRRRAPACSVCVCGGGRRTTMACRGGRVVWGVSAAGARWQRDTSARVVRSHNILEYRSNLQKHRSLHIERDWFCYTSCQAPKCPQRPN